MNVRRHGASILAAAITMTPFGTKADQQTPTPSSVQSQPAAMASKPFVSLIELQIDVLGSPGVLPWAGYFLGGSALFERYLVKGLGVGVYQSFHLQPPSFGFTLITQTQLSVGYTLGWTSQKRVQFGAYFLAGLLVAGSHGRASYPELGVDETFSAVSVWPVLSGLLSLRVWVSRMVALSAQVYVPAYPFLSQALDNQAKLLSIGLTISPQRPLLLP